MDSFVKEEDERQQMTPVSHRVDYNPSQLQTQSMQVGAYTNSKTLMRDVNQPPLYQPEQPDFKNNSQMLDAQSHRTGYTHTI
jgi:hypothetical protein